MNSQARQQLGHHLQHLRQARALSLSQLAMQAGMAKSNLSRLEQGEGNPTIDTLWRLARELAIPFATLLAPMAARVQEHGVCIELLDQGQGLPAVDVYRMRLAPDVTRRAEAHAPGTVETLQLIDGCLEAGVDDALVTLRPGDMHTFDADRPHRYRNHDIDTTLLVTIVYRGGP